MMRFVLTALMLTNFFLVFGQEDPDPIPETEVPIIQYSNSRLFGKVVDQSSAKGVDAASVQLLLANSDSIFAGMLTKANGNFVFEKVSAGTEYRLLITAMGYETMELSVSFPVPQPGASPISKDMGNIEMYPEIKQLEGVVITASRPAMEMNIDRRVFNVEKNLSATGGTAIDVMKNIPSISVDVDGNVELRNAAPQIFVDGRPTILTLDQIPSDHIDRVELITNPSAKYDAETSGGIINVILKKEKRFGLNGITTVAVGTPGVLTGNISLNLRQGKLNYFVNAGYNQTGGRPEGRAFRTNKTSGTITDYFRQYSEEERKRRFASVNFGVDYDIDIRNSISFVQRIGGGRTKAEELQHQDYLDVDQMPLYYGNRLTNSNNNRSFNSSRVSYKYKFPQEGREFSTDVTFNYGGGNSGSTIQNDYLTTAGHVYQPSTLVNNAGEGKRRQVTAEANYTHPINEHTKFEGGARFYLNKNTSLFDVFRVDGSDRTKLPLSNNYEYTENINALYGTFSQKRGSFSYQLGLRAEYSKFDGLLVDSAYKFGYQYPQSIKDIWNALFPSLFLTQDLNEKEQIQFNFSRRIRRPNFWQINPFIEISDPMNLRQGNPALRPEFVNSFELNYNKNYKSGNLLAVLFWRNNPDDITMFSDTLTAEKYADLQNAGVEPNAILNTFVNANTTNRYGAELTVQQKLIKNLEITPTLNLQYRKVNAVMNDRTDLSNEGFNWNGKLIVAYKISSENRILDDLSFQGIGNYESSRVIPQGKRLPQYGIDLAVRKELLNKKATITLAVNDVLDSRRWGTIYDTETFYQDAYRRWNVRSFRISFTYKFGKTDFHMFKQRGSGDEDS